METDVRMTLEVVEIVGDDLLRELAPLIGRPDEMRAVFLHWLDVLGDDFPLVAMAALRDVFLDWLKPVAISEWPDEGITLTQPERHTT